MSRLVRDLVGALVIAVTSYLLGLLHGVVMSCQAIEDALDVGPDTSEPPIVNRQRGECGPECQECNEGFAALASAVLRHPAGKGRA